MILIVLAMAAGIGAALGPLAFLAWPAVHLSAALVGLGTHLSTQLTHNATPKTQSIVTALAAALMPALVAAGLLLAARATRTVRKLVATLALLAALAGWFVLPAAQAGALTLFCILAIIAAFIAGSIAGPFFAFCGAYLATATIHSLYVTQPASKLHLSALTLSHYVNISPRSVQLILSALIALICLAGAAAALRSPSPVPTS
jgi:hypothetical protein